MTDEKDTERIIKVDFTADGSTCHSCEQIITRQALKVEGVKSAEFSYETEKGSVSFDASKTNINEIFAKIEEKGYKPSLISKGKKEDTDEGEYFRIDRKALGIAGLVLGILVLGFFIFRFAEVINIPSISKDMSLGLIFLVGLLTGFHCVAMCGGFVVGYTAKASQEGKKTYKSHIYYGVGKTLSYTIIGALFGLLGSIIAFTPQLRGTLAIIAGLFLLLFGLKMLGAFSFLRRFGFRQPMFISKFSARLGRRGPLVIGLLNGLMIACGPLQAMYVLAAGSGSMIEGAKMLLVFGLGTLPVMLGFGYVTSFISAKATHKILKFSGLVVMALGLIMLNNGLVLTGSGLDFNSIADGAMANQGTNTGSTGTAVPYNVAVLKDGYQEIRMTVDASGWSPDNFVLKTGVPVRWIIDVKQLTNCNKAIQVPAYMLKFDLKMGEQVIEFTPVKAGTVRWSCWMGMIPGTFIVKDDISADATVVQQDLQNVQAGQVATAAPTTGGCGCGGTGSGSGGGCGGTGGCTGNHSGCTGGCAKANTGVVSPTGSCH